MPEQYGGGEVLLSHLLLSGDSNTKLAKSNQAGTSYLTFGLSLSPANESGFQMCSSSSSGCRSSCLFFQGRAAFFPSVNRWRVAKTIAFHEHRDWFRDTLRADLNDACGQARRRGLTPAVRLNVLSDVMWEKVFPWAFRDYQEIAYYDYGKHFKRMLRWCRGELPANYHLTFSRSEHNDDECVEVLREGGNVAVVFHTVKKTDALPPTWQGYPVIDGDKSDLRFLDPFPGYVVGLRAKGRARKDVSGFAVPLSVQTLALV